MPLARKCIRCGRTFLAKKDEQYCAQCAKEELMAILNKDKTPTPVKDESPKEEVKEKVMTKCKNCGKMFEQTGKGRPAVNCPTCRDLLNKPKNKVSPKDKQPEKVAESAPVISKMETTEYYINSESVQGLYDCIKAELQDYLTDIYRAWINRYNLNDAAYQLTNTTMYRYSEILQEWQEV